MKNTYLWNPLYKKVMELKTDFIKENKIDNFNDIYNKYLGNSQYDNFITYMCNNVSKSEEYLNIFMPLIIKENNGIFLFKYDDFVFQKKASEIGGKPFFDLYGGLYRYCRSIVIDVLNDNLVIAPFKKFFNIDELEECSFDKVVLMCENAKANGKNVEFSNKLDGTMMAGRFYNDNYFLSSALSVNKYTSWRLADGYNMLTSNKGLMHMLKDNPTKTFMFEYISLQDTHVVKYKKEQEGLYLTGIINTYTGNESSYKEVIDYASKYKVLSTKTFDKDIHTILKELDDKKSNEAEGFVINIDGSKVKLKYNDYVKVHRILSEISTPNLAVEMIADDKFDDFISRIPFVYRDNVYKVAENIYKYVDDVENYIDICMKSIPEYLLPNKAQTCKYITDNFDKKFYAFVIRKYLNFPYNVLKNQNGAIPNYTQILERDNYICNLIDKMQYSKDITDSVHEI